VLRREVIAWSPDAALLRDPMQVDTSLLASGRCDVTTAVAGWLRTRVLGDATATGRPGKARALRCSLHLQARAEPRLLGGVGSATRRNRPGSGSLSRRQVRHGRPPDAAAGGNARAAHRRQAAPPPRLLAKITAVEGDPPPVSRRPRALRPSRRYRWWLTALDRRLHGYLLSAPVVPDVDHVAVWCSDKEPAVTPGFCS